MSKLTYDQDKRDKWRWKLKADNGVTIGASTQGYVRRGYCVLNAEIVRKGLIEANRVIE